MALGIGDAVGTCGTFGRGDEDDLGTIDGLAVERDCALGGDGFWEIAAAGTAAEKGQQARGQEAGEQH
jgi:hypothetical protein